MPDNILKYIFRDKSGAKHTVWKSDYDADPQGFAKAYPDARFEVINRKTGDRGHVSVNDVGAAQKEGFNLFTMKAYQKEHYKKPATTAQRAMQVPYRPKTQLGKAPKSAPKNASPFVQSLYETDNAQNGPEYPIDYTSPNAVKQVNQRNREVAKQASTTAVKKMGRQASHAQPIMQTNTPADTYIGKTEGQLMDEMDQSANTLVGSEMGDYLDKVIGDEFKAAHARGLAALSANSGVHGTGGADWWIGERAYQNQMDQDKQLQEITGNIQKNIESIFSDPKVKQRVLSDAQRLGVSPEAYIESSLAPALIEKAGEQFNKTQLNRMMAKGASDYIASGILNSLTGTLLTGLTSTKSQRQMQQQADAMTEEGLNPNYKPGTWAKAAKGAVAFAADAPWYNLSGIGAGALTEKVFGNAAQQMARMANQSLRQRVFEGVARGVVHGGATGFQYGAINGAVQNYSTGEDTSLLGTLKAAAKGGLEEGVSFATMEGMGGAVGAFGHGIGLKGTEKTWKQRVNKMGQKLTYEGIKTGMEGIGMATGGVASSYANHVLTGDDWHGFSTEGTLESCASAVIFKLTHAKDLFKKETDRNGKPFSFTSNIAQKTARFFLSGEAKSAPHVFSDEEKHQLFAAGSELGMKPMENIVSWAKQAKKYRAEDIEKSEDGSDLLNNYQQIMQDPNVSWDAKAKFTTMVMGTMPESRPMMDHISYGTEEGTDGDNRIHTYKTVNEYASDGTLLSKHRFDTKDKRESIIYEIGVRKEELRSKNALALLVGLDRNNYDLQNAFFKENAKDWEQVQGIVEGMQTGGSKIDHQFTEYVLNSERGSFLPIVDAVASKNGMDRESMLKAFDKDPMKRSDAEQNACVQLRKAIEMSVFPANKVHEEQSAMDGKDVATDNNLGTEQPNGEAVKEELNGLKQAEDEMDVLIRDNDVFNQNFQKLKQQGLTNPQIYDWMVQQGGLTVEQLEPFAHYINANARVQGMQEATKNAIDQHVSSYVQDWTFHGTLNGQEMNGEQAIFVQDRDGRTLILGSGEIAFDSTTGRAKEGVGDMIVCLDPNTNEMVYLKTDDVTLSQTQDAENFGNEYRQKLQMINSQPYNEAAQKQAMIDAAKPQQENGKATDTTSMENDAALSQPEGNVKGTENNSTGQENSIINDGKGGIDTNGNIRNSDGSIYTEPVKSINDITDNDFNEPTRSVELPPVPENVSVALGANGKPIIIKKNIFEKNLTHHAELEPEDSRAILENALYNPNLIGQTQPVKRPSYKVAVQTGDRNSIVVLDIYNDKKQVEIIGWRLINEKGLEKMKRQAEREGGQFLILSPKDGSAAALSTLPHDLSSTGKDTNNSSNGNGSEATLTFENGEKVPVDANGEPDFLKMTPEQGAEVYKMLFEEDAEKQIDSDINTLEKDLKKVQNAKYEGASVMERAEARKKAKEAIAIAEAQVEKAKAIKKTMTAKKVAESVSKPAESAEGANEASSTVAKKFQNAPRMQGNSVSKRLPDGTKLKGHYEIVPAESLTPSHDAMNGYKKTEGFPVDENGRTVNDRDYENDKAAQQVTDQMAQNYSGQAITQVPTVSDEGIVYDGNGRTMAGQKAAKNGADAEYIEDLLDNAQNYGFTREQIEKSGIEHPRLVMVTDERLPYDTATFSKFNRNEKKTQSNTEQAVAKAKTLTSDEVGAIVAEIEGNGTLDAFFNNSKAINDLVKTLVDKGIIGQNEVSGMMDSPERLSAQGREYVKNLLLGSIFKPETIRMLGIEPTLKNKAINAIRSVMDNLKLGDFSLRDEIDQAIQLLYEARRGGNKVDTLLRTPDMFGEDAAKRYPSISQMMALALEGKVSDFRDLLDEYNRIAASRNTGEGDVFGDAPTKEELVNEFLNFKKWQDYGTRHSENEGSNDVSGTEKPQQETSGGNESAGEAGSEPERPRVEEPDDLVNKELESRIKVTDEETETPSENGPITRQKILIDGNKEVTKVDEPNEKGEYTGSYYEYDGKKFGDLNEVAEYIDEANAEVKRRAKNADPIESINKAAEGFNNDKLEAARNAYAEAKKSGDESEIKRTRDELKQRLDEHYKAQHMGLVQRRKEIAKEIGMPEAKKIDKPFSEMDSEEREYVANQNPLTESEIREQTSEENKNFIEDAVDYINGNHGFAQKMAYLKIYDDVRNRHENATDNSGAENGAQLAPADNGSGEGLELGTGRESGGSDGPVDRGTGNEAAPGEPESREGNQNDPTLSVGKPGDKQGAGNSSDMGAVPSGNTDTKGSGTTGKDGNVSEQGGRGSSNRPAKPDAKRKPAAKQGTTWRGRTGEEIKKNVADKKSAALAAIAELKKRKFGKGGSGHLGSFELLTPEQMEYVPTVMNAVKEYGMAIIDEGIYKVKDWFNHIRETFAGGLKDCGFTDQDIDDFIKEMWNSKMTMDGETHTIAEWCSIYGNQKLREKLGEELDVKYQKQMDAEPIEVKIGDRKNIEETLPFLLPQQQDDVLKAETQFFGEEHTDSEHAYGKGYLFTNGTGTGKTYTGLGIAKRLAKQGKGRILFITPSQKKVSDWIKDGRNLNMDIRDLDSVAKEKGTTATTESGDGMVITTYANFRQNKKLLETDWDAVIYDECHRIMENKKGTETTGSNQHYMVTNRNENFCFLRLQSINPEYQKMNDAAEKFSGVREKEIMRIQKEYRESHPSATTKDVINATHNDLPRELINFAPADGVRFPKLGKVYQEFVKARDAYNKVEPKLKEQAKNGWKNTKTVFLSATPFNTRENLDYVEGYIFKYPETDERGMSGRTQFYLNHFGAAYKYRYHRLEQTISNPDAVAKQEVAFSDYLQNTLGTMSGRIIDSPYDYSRDFPTVAPDHAKEFNDAVQSILKAKYLYDAYSKTIGDYNYGSALFETMKVSAAIDRIKQHLDMGRKVVIFHRRVESKEPLEAPFAYMLSVANEQIKLMKPGKDRDEYIKECSEFREKYADLLDWEQTLDYSMPREQIAKVFGKDNVLFFSGKESKKVKDKAVDTFNDDNSGKNIIVIQEASGKEGISLHDVTGNHQRVLITLGLPQSPITALQIEGRTYRIGNKSNAIFEYPILGLNSEMMLFGEKFNNQVSTTENLALGSQARNLRDSFANGILEHSGVVPVENQGVGGKEFDAPKQNDSNPFDDAVLDYYSNQKLNKNNRAGNDYFPTPEPLGYKMVEWAGMGEGDSVLEPSAGHGAIARYVPKSNEMVSIEPSQSLFTKLQLKAGGLGRKFLNNTFENYALSNKHDVIVMNPPFGKAGTLAIQHVDKAFKHLDEGGRIVAIIPRGITDRKFDKWYGEQKNIAMRAEINLPDIVFQQAGTNVSCRVVVLDKITDAALRSKAGYPEKIDLSGHYDKIEDFFNDLRDIEIPDRIIDTNLKMQKKAKSAVKDIMEIKGVKNVAYGKEGINVSLSGSWINYGISFTGSDKPNYWRDKMANYYTKYDDLQKLEYQENKQAVFDELKKLSCKLAGMTEDEMQRYIASKNNGGTHFRESRGSQYSKSDTKDVKNSRIIPEDVDKNVSSQIEKSYDAEVNRLFGHNLSPDEKQEVEDIANLYTLRSLHDEYRIDEDTEEKINVMGLDSAYKFWNNRVTEFEQKYGINRNTDIPRFEEETRKAFANEFFEGGNSGRFAVQDNIGQRENDKSESRAGRERGRAAMPTLAEIYRYKRDVLKRESVLRAYSYHKERVRILSEKYGVESDRWIKAETIEKIFNDFNTDKNLKVLFDRIKEQVNDLDVYFGEFYGEEEGTDGFYRHDSLNDIRLNIDGLLTAARTRQEFASVILHEMLHPLTSDIIAMYQKGHADKLTKSQAEAAKNVVDIYDRLKSLYKEKGWKEPYALTNPREMMTELANPSWREALQGFEEGRSIWRKILDSVRKFFGFAPTRPGLSDLNKALDNVLNNFGKEQFDFATRHSKELFGKEPQGHKVTDPEEIKRLEEEPKIKVYRAMQVIDGKLYPPMAASVGGKLVEANELGQWICADENPDLAIPDVDPKTGKQKVDKKTGELKWKFKLDKGGKDATGKKATDINAAYNPYWHMSRSPLNDQFKSAWIRPNIVVVECETPVSELSSGYKAERAKDAVGEVDWKSGSVSGEVFKQTGRARKVILSRWCKPVRVLDDAEVAQRAKEFVGDANVEIPENVLTPKQRIAFEEAGFKIGAPEKGVKKSEQIMEALEKGLTIDNTVLSNDGAKFRTDHGNDNYPTSSVENHVEKVAQKTGAKVQMVSSVDEITNKAAKAAIEEGRKITGWYDEKTGEVHLYMPNIHDRYTAEKTIWHETVGHKAMRGLIGDENYSSFLRDIYYNLDKPEYADLKKLVDEELRYNPFGYETAVEEGIARLAEEGKGEYGFWNNIRNKVTDFLHEIGYRIAPNIKDVKYLLWLSKNLQKNPNDPYWKMRAEAVKYRLSHEDVRSVVERNGMYFDNDGKSHDYLLDLNRKDFEEATDGKVHFRTTPTTASKIEEYNRRLATKLYAFKESTVDHMQSLQEAMEVISGEKDVWNNIPSSFNPLLAQNRMDSVVQQLSESYDRKITKPLDESFQKVVSLVDGENKDEQLRNAQLYMITKHGLERNRVFFVRDTTRDMKKDDELKATSLQAEWTKKHKDLSDDLEKGKIRFDEYLNQMDEWIRSNVDISYVADEHDYSGFHGMQKKDIGDKYDDKLAIDNIMSVEKKLGGNLVKDFWSKKKAATDYIIDQQYTSGFVDEVKRDYLKGMFQWYVPLRKFDSTTAEDIYGYITGNGDVTNYVGPTLANAKGRSSLSDVNVLAQISAMAKTSIINGGKNVVKQHLARFISAYENGETKNRIFVEVNPWVEKHTIDGNEVWEEATPQIPEDATQEQISDILQGFENNMKAKQASGDAKMLKNKADIGFKFQRAKDKSEHIVDIYIAGKKKSFVCQGNPRAAQAINGLLVDSGARNAVSEIDAKITRKLAQFNTSLNPDFMSSNMLRDLTFASANVTKEGFGYTKDFLKEYAKNIRSIKNLSGKGNYLTMFRRYREDKLDINNERERMFKEFMDNGGQTGFVQIKKLEDLIEEYDNLIKKGNKDADRWLVKKIKKGASFIEAANEIVEGVARYSTYCTSRKHGRSIGKSIYDAKEVSTNFNRHGSGDAVKTLKTANDSKLDKKFRGALGFFNSWMKNHTQFYNAGVQGASLLFKNYKSAAMTTAVSFGFMPFGLGIAQAFINQLLISREDEKDRNGIKDPYAELPEWKRRNNICIYWGHGKFKTIPLAIELRAFFGIGDIAAGYIVNENLKSDTPIGYDILGQIAQLVPASDFLGHHSPSSSIKEVGEDVLLGVTPTTLKPFAELATNRDWTGRPFYRDKDYLDKAPRWKSAYDNTSDIYMTINKWANQSTNGIDASNPDMKGNETLDYLTAPYGWQHVIDSYTGGMGSTIRRTYDTGSAAIKGVVSGAKSKEGFGEGFSKEWSKLDKNQIPLYRVFNYTPPEGNNMQRTKSKWYNYTDEFKQIEYNLSQLKTDTPDLVKNVENHSKQYKFTHSDKGKAYNIWKAADDYIYKKRRDLKKTNDPVTKKSIEEQINIKMQEAVNDLDKLN